jgi:hypothetical protein
MSALFRGLIVALAFVVGPLWAARAVAQDPPPRIGPFVIDLQGAFPQFPQDEQLAQSRGLLLNELPGSGLGIHTGAHVYIFTWKALTIGLGVDLTLGRSHQDAQVVPPSGDTPATTTRAVTETFRHVAPELSLNFGTGDGWSYLSVGIGPSTWAIVPDGTTAEGPDAQRIRTINYGGGARWFLNHHMAFSVDGRFYQLDPTEPYLGRINGPRTTFLSVGVGISVR